MATLDAERRSGALELNCKQNFRAVPQYSEYVRMFAVESITQKLSCPSPSAMPAEADKMDEDKVRRNAAVWTCMPVLRVSTPLGTTPRK